MQVQRPGQATGRPRPGASCAPARALACCRARPHRVGRWHRPLQMRRPRSAGAGEDCVRSFLSGMRLHSAQPTSELLTSRLLVRGASLSPYMTRYRPLAEPPRLLLGVHRMGRPAGAPRNRGVIGADSSSPRRHARVQTARTWTGSRLQIMGFIQRVRKFLQEPRICRVITIHESTLL